MSLSILETGPPHPVPYYRTSGGAHARLESRVNLCVRRGPEALKKREQGLSVHG